VRLFLDGAVKIVHTGPTIQAKMSLVTARIIDKDVSLLHYSDKKTFDYLTVR